MASIGDDVEFTTKPDMRLRMLQSVVASGIRFGWVTADELYGQAGRIRLQCFAVLTPRTSAHERNQ
ncbi:SRSO17 transposase [Streptomyces sp. V1I6]|nr:SRSO17 transposase [Streptomyces sp. V1I6]